MIFFACLLKDSQDKVNIFNTVLIILWFEIRADQCAETPVCTRMLLHLLVLIMNCKVHKKSA